MRRPRGVALAAAAAAGWLLAAGILAPAGAPLLGPDAATASSRAAAVEHEVAEALDAERARVGAPPLAHLDEMNEVSRAFARQLAREGGLRHNSNARVQVEARDLTAESVTEIVGWTTARDSAATDARVLIDAWRDSDAHRTWLHADDRTHVGVGAAQADGRVYVVVSFGRDVLRPAVRAGLSDDLGRAEYAVIGRSDDPADTLTAGALAGADGLLAFADPPRHGGDAGPHLPAGTVEHLDATLPAGAPVYIIGGAAAVGTRVEDELAARGYDVDRLGGADRYATAAAVADEVVARHGRPDRVVVAGGHDWPDAVAGSVWAAGDGAPVVLTRGDEVPGPTADVLASHRDADRVVLGGPAAVGDEVVDALGATRVSGTDRYGTAVAVASELFAPEPDAVLLALGHGEPTVWGHALGLSRVAADAGAALVLVHPEEGLPTPAARELSASSSESPEIILAEGVDESIADEVEALTGP